MEPLDAILNMFTIIGMVCSIMAASAMILLLTLFAREWLWRQQEAQKQREQSQIRTALDDAWWEAFKKTAIQQVDLMFQEHKKGGDTDPQIPAMG